MSAQELQEKQKRLLCQYNECDTPRKYYCFTHQTRLCGDCSDALHYDCSVQLIGCSDELWRSAGLVESLLKTLTHKASEFELISKIDHLRDCLKHFTTVFTDYEEQVREAVTKDKFHEYSRLTEQAKEMKRDILNGNFGDLGTFDNNSNPFLRLLYDSELIHSSYSKITLETKKEARNIPSFNQAVREAVTDYRIKLEVKAEEEVKERKAQAEEEAEAKFRDEIQALTQDSQTQKEAADRIILDLNNKISNQENLIAREKIQKDEIEDQFSALTLEHQKLKDQMEELNLRLTANQDQLKQKEGVLKYVGGSVAEAIYKETMGSSKTFDSTTNLELNFSNDKDRNLIAALGEAQVKLPSIARIYINYAKNSHLETLDKFLTHCSPASLPLLCLNLDCSELLESSNLPSVFSGGSPSPILSKCLQVVPGWRPRAILFSQFFQSLANTLSKATKQASYFSKPKTSHKSTIIKFKQNLKLNLYSFPFKT
ncbi:unnamed protein product [Moneuplotes crassus]|uniref:Uncharacterized protein n=1 Tax=Euplotes crassus TaxID=5936 RepID=A0AAD1U147_EUPCR|nr:unnamed protein product [Moneuplotes crassus]